MTDTPPEHVAHEHAPTPARQYATVLSPRQNGRAPYRLQAHLWRTANELGMTPVLGPASPDSVSGNHPALLVNTAGGLQILDAGPPPFPAGGAAPAWCEAQVAVPGMLHPVWLISVHLPGPLGHQPAHPG